MFAAPNVLPFLVTPAFRASRVSASDAPTAQWRMFSIRVRSCPWLVRVIVPAESTERSHSSGGNFVAIWIARHVPESAPQSLNSHAQAIKNFAWPAWCMRKPGNEIPVSQGWDEPRRALNARYHSMECGGLDSAFDDAARRVASPPRLQRREPSATLKASTLRAEPARCS